MGSVCSHPVHLFHLLIRPGQAGRNRSLPYPGEQSHWEHPGHHAAASSDCSLLPFVQQSMPWWEQQRYSPHIFLMVWKCQVESFWAQLILGGFSCSSDGLMVDWLNGVHGVRFGRGPGGRARSRELVSTEGKCLLVWGPESVFNRLVKCLRKCINLHLTYIKNRILAKSVLGQNKNKQTK